MAEGSSDITEAKTIGLIIKTAKEKEVIEVDENGSVKEVTR